MSAFSHLEGHVLLSVENVFLVVGVPASLVVDVVNMVPSLVGLSFHVVLLDETSVSSLELELGPDLVSVVSLVLSSGSEELGVSPLLPLSVSEVSKLSVSVVLLDDHCSESSVELLRSDLFGPVLDVEVDVALHVINIVGFVPGLSALDIPLILFGPTSNVFLVSGEAPLLGSQVSLEASESILVLLSDLLEMASMLRGPVFPPECVSSDPELSKLLVVDFGGNHVVCPVSSDGPLLVDELEDPLRIFLASLLLQLGKSIGSGHVQLELSLSHSLLGYQLSPMIPVF